jgi:predicted flap endonuclease-1-like 5' DNA nuclease
MPTKNKHDPKKAYRILRKLPFTESFFFYEEVDKATNEFANSLSMFSKKLKNIPLKSIDFHSRRGDFEKWIKETIGDKELSEKIKKISMSKSGSNLKESIQKIVKERISAMKSSTLKGIKGIGPKSFKKLKSIGVESAEQLAEKNPKYLSENLKVSEKTIKPWIENAKKLLNK